MSGGKSPTAGVEKTGWLAVLFSAWVFLALPSVWGAEAKKAADDVKTKPAASAAEKKVVEKTVVEKKDAKTAGHEAQKKANGDNGKKGVFLSPADCIEIAVQNNLGLRMQRLSDRESDLGVKEAWAEYLPTFRLGTGYAHSRTGGAKGEVATLTGGVTQRTPIGTTLDFGLSETHTWPGAGTRNVASSYDLTVTQPLWRGAGLDVGLYNIRSTRIQRLISRGQLELAVQELIFNVQRSYAGCVSLLEQRKVNLNSVESAKTFVKLTEAQYRAGLVTQLDVFSAEVQLAQRRLDLTQTERALGDAFDALKRVMDVDLEETILVKEDPVDFGETSALTKAAGQKAVTLERRVEVDEKKGRVLLRTYKVTYKKKSGGRTGTDKVLTPQGKVKELFASAHFNEAEVLRTALRNRIDLLNQRRTVALRKLNVLLRKDGLGHEVDLTGTYGRSDSGSSYGESHKYRDENYSVSLNVSIPWGKVSDRAAYERALLDLRRAELQRKDVRSQVHQEVRGVLRQLRETERTILLRAQQVEQGKRTVEAANVSFKRGRANAFDVIRAEDDLLRAKVFFIRGKQNYIVRLADLARVVGKPTGRVDLSGKSRGGNVLARLSEELRRRGLPAAAPDAAPDKNDNP